MDLKQFLVDLQAGLADLSFTCKEDSPSLVIKNGEASGNIIAAAFYGRYLRLHAGENPCDGEHDLTEAHNLWNMPEALKSRFLMIAFISGEQAVMNEIKAYIE